MTRTPDRRDRVASGYDRAAAGYDDRHGDPRSLRRAAWLDAPLIETTRGARRVLELGCGTGRLLASLAAPIRLGVDVSPAMLAQARARGCTVCCGDAEQLPFADGSFDAVVAGKGVFRYLDPARAFAEAARVLGRNGRLALHQFGARTWSPRRSAPVRDPGAWSPDPGAQPPTSVPVWELDSVSDLLTPARAAGFTVTAIALWRPVRVFPYLLAIPPWLDRASPIQLWSHCVATFRKLA